MPKHRYTNHYRHKDCPEQPGIEWSDAWSCMCNDRCPACGREIEPYRSEERRAGAQGAVSTHTIEHC